MRLAARGHLAFLAALDLLQLAAEVADAFFDQAAIFFQLCFARAAKSHALLLTRQVRPHPLQPRHGVFELGEFDRQPGLVVWARVAKMSRINSVRSRTFTGRLLQIACLGRA